MPSCCTMRILEYSGYDNLALTWMLNLKKEKPRYYNLNLRMLASNIEHFEVDTLHLVFSKFYISSKL